MKNSEKNSSKQVNSVNNETLNVETIKAQLKAACINMNAAQTKEYIKGLDGYELKLTGQKPTQHYTVFYGEARVCNVEQVQGIKADGTSRGCSSVAKVNFFDSLQKLYAAKLQKLREDLTREENNSLEELECEIYNTAAKMQDIFDSVNKRAAEAAEAAAKAKRAEAAKERAQNKMNNKLKESSDNEKIAALAAVLDISFDEAKIIFEKKRAQKTA